MEKRPRAFILALRFSATISFVVEASDVIQYVFVDLGNCEDLKRVLDDTRQYLAYGRGRYTPATKSSSSSR